MTTLDILMPHFNDPEGLALSLRSIEAQTWTGPMRVVIADDGSRPESLEQVRRIVGESPLRIDLLERSENRGRPYTRNELLDAVEGDYIAWQDAGDEWYPEKTALQMDVLSKAAGKRGDAHVWVTCDYDWSHDDRVRLCRQRVDFDPVHDLLVGRMLRAYLWTILAPAKAFKALGPFDENLPRLQDLDMFLRFALTDGVMLKPEGAPPLCVYHKSFIGRNADEIWRCQTYIYDKYRAVYGRYGKRFEQKRMYDMARHAARFAEANGDKAKASMYKRRAIRTRPFYSIGKMIGIR